MGSRSRLTALLLCGAVVVACGRSVAESSPSGSSTTTSTIGGAADPVVGDVGGTSDVVVVETEGVSWRLRRTPRPSDRALWLIVEDPSCNSGRPADDRVDIGLDETATTITVTLAVRPPEGNQTCQGSPPTTVTVPLNAEVGDRQVVDALGSHIAPTDPVEQRLGRLRTDTPSTEIDPLTVTRAGRDTLIDHSCDGVAHIREVWNSDGGAYPTPGLAAAAAAEHFDLSMTGWHVIAMPSFQDRDESHWLQFRDSQSVVAVSVVPEPIGWSVWAGVCPDLLPGWQPDAVPGGVFRFQELTPLDRLDVDAILGLAGVSANDDGTWAFPDPTTRCETWMRIEDAALDAGWPTESGWYGNWPDTVDRDGGTVPYEGVMTIGYGPAATLVTDGAVIRVEQADLIQGFDEGPQPCRLDEALAYEVAP